MQDCLWSRTGKGANQFLCLHQRYRLSFQGRGISNAVQISSGWILPAYPCMSRVISHDYTTTWNDKSQRVNRQDLRTSVVPAAEEWGNAWVTILPVCCYQHIPWILALLCAFRLHDTREPIGCDDPIQLLTPGQVTDSCILWNHRGGLASIR